MAKGRPIEHLEEWLSGLMNSLKCQNTIIDDGYTIWKRPRDTFWLDYGVLVCLEGSFLGIFDWIDEDHCGELDIRLQYADPNFYEKAEAIIRAIVNAPNEINLTNEYVQCPT